MGIYLCQNHFNECNKVPSVKYNDWINFKEHFLLERKFEKLIKISDFKNCDLNRDFNQCDFNQTTPGVGGISGSLSDVTKSGNCSTLPHFTSFVYMIVTHF